MEIREDRDAALKRLEHVESLLKAQGGSENKQLVATKRANKVLMKRVENVNMLRKKKRPGSTKLRNWKVRKQRRPRRPPNQNNPQAVPEGAEEERHGRRRRGCRAARAVTVSPRLPPDAWSGSRI